MRRFLYTTFFVIFILLLIGAGYYYLTGQDNIVSPTTGPMPTAPGQTREQTVTPELTNGASPTQDRNTVDDTGQITDIVGPVGYKNSLLITVDSTNVYITEETQVVDQNNNTVARSTIREGQSVVINGVPAEGGIEASKITILASSP